MATYPHVMPSHVNVTHGMAMIGSTPGETAVLADCHLLRFAVIQPVFVVLGASPRLHILHLDQQVSRIGRRLLQMCLYMRLATRCITPEANFLRRQRRSSPTENAMENTWCFLHIKSIEFFNNIWQFMVLFQGRLLAVGMVAFRTSHHTCIFGPSLIDASSTKVVFARKLDWLGEHVQTYGTDELLLKGVLPIFCHSHQIALFLLKAQITQVVSVVLIKHCDLYHIYWLRGHSQQQDQLWRDRRLTVISHILALIHHIWRDVRCCRSDWRYLYDTTVSPVG